jgi:hypothetical protein
LKSRVFASIGFALFCWKKIARLIRRRGLQNNGQARFCLPQAGLGNWVLKSLRWHRLAFCQCALREKPLAGQSLNGCLALIYCPVFVGVELLAGRR